MSASWYNKRYRTPDEEIQRINNILKNQALERAQQERPSSTVECISVQMESLVGIHDKHKAKLWNISDVENFKLPMEPDGNVLRCGADFNVGVTINDSAYFGNIINVIGYPEKTDGLEDGGIMHVPIDLKFNGSSEYIRIKDNPNIRIKEIMESPPVGVDGFTIIFRITPLLLDPDKPVYLLSKFDNNSMTYGMQILIKPDGKVEFWVIRNNVVRAVFSSNPFTIIPPPAGNFYISNYMEQNYLVVAGNKVSDQEYILFFQYKLSDNSMKILKGNTNNTVTDITAGVPSGTITIPAPLPEPPEPPGPQLGSKITVISSIASGQDSGHPITDAFDNNLTTYWMHSFRAAYIIADLGVAQRLTAVEIAWALGTSVRYYHDIFTGNQLDITKMTRLTPNTRLSSGTTTARERFNFPAEQFARYVMIAGYGNQGNPTPSPPVPVWLDLDGMNAEATASGSESPNVPANAKDDNLNTRWASKGRGEWLKIDLKVNKIVTRLGIAWYYADKRRYRYKVETSTNNENWSLAHPFDGSANTLSDIQDNDKEFDHVPFQKSTVARYIRITVYGNTTNEWANIWEVRVRAHEPGSTAEPQSNFGISEFDVWGFPSQIEQEPYTKVYENPITSPNTDEFLLRLHASGASSDFVPVYSVTTLEVARVLGAHHDRFARGQLIKKLGGTFECPFFNQILTKVSCFARKVGNPTGTMWARIYDSEGNIVVEFGSLDVSTLTTSYVEKEFTKTSTNYKMTEGDSVAFIYFGGDENNYLELASTSTSVVPDCVMYFYSSESGSQTVDEVDLCGKYYTGVSSSAPTSNLVAAQEVLTTSSSIYGNVLTKFVFNLRRKGTPTGNVNFKLYDPQNTELYTLGSIAASSITNSTTSLTSVEIDATVLANVQSLVGYKVGVEYTGGNPDNYIMVKLHNDDNASSGLAIKNSKDIWSLNLSKDLAATFYKGGKVRVVGGDPIPPTPTPLEHYSHDLFLFAAGEENLRLRRFMYALRGFYNGKANKFRFYRKVLNDTEMINWTTNKKSISAIPYGKIFTPLTLVLNENFAFGGGGVFTFSSAFSLAFNTGGELTNGDPFSDAFTSAFNTGAP